MHREKKLILTNITLNCSHLKNLLHKKKKAPSIMGFPCIHYAIQNII
jgi:hypothetical protein